MSHVPSPLNSNRRWYDITIPLQEGVAHWPGDTPFHFEHVATIAAGDAVDVGSVSMSVHSGTHVDAPSHFRQGAPHSHEIDLAILVGPAYVVNAVGHDLIGPELFAGLNFTSAPRVLLHTGRWTDYGHFPETIPTLSAEAVAFLGGQGVVLLGMDLPSVDALDSKDLPMHHAIERSGMIVLEGLNLQNVPPGRYHLTALPLRLVGADASPVRALLIADGSDA